MDDLEEFTPWRHQTEGRLVTLESMTDGHADKINRHQGVLSSMDRDIGVIQAEFRRQEGMLQALHLTQQEQGISLRELKAGQEALRLGQNEMRAEMRAGLRTIVDLLTPDADTGAADGSE